MENNNNSLTRNYSHIDGWGIDADPNNNPTYPIKKRVEQEEKGNTWERPSLQPVDVEVHHSIERPNVTAVFGTSTPPSGLSGMIRRYAFKHSENTYRHWLSLLFADRVNVVEGIIDDLSRGHVPNIFAEKGLKMDWKYNRAALLQKVAIGAVLTTAAVLYFTRDKRD